MNGTHSGGRSARTRWPSLGWRTTRPPTRRPSPAPAPSAEPQFTVAEPQQFSAPPMPRYRRRRRRGGVFIVLIVRAGDRCRGVRAASSRSSRSRRDAVDGLEGAIREAVPTVVAPPPIGTEQGSLLRAGTLKDALAKLPPGDIVLIRVAPERIDAQVSRRQQDATRPGARRRRRHHGDLAGTAAPATRSRSIRRRPRGSSRTAARRAGRDPERRLLPGADAVRRRRPNGSCSSATACTSPRARTARKFAASAEPEEYIRTYLIAERIRGA